MQDRSALAPSLRMAVGPTFCYKEATPIVSVQATALGRHRALHQSKASFIPTEEPSFSDRNLIRMLTSGLGRLLLVPTLPAVPSPKRMLIAGSTVCKPRGIVMFLDNSSKARQTVNCNEC